MDLSKYSTADLEALQAGDLTRVSTEGLERMQSSATMEGMGAVQSPKSGAWAMPSLERPQTGILEALAAGAGKKVNDIGAGVKQLMGFTSKDPAANKELDQEQKFLDAAYNPVRKARPIASRFGEMVPEAAAAMAMTGGPGLIPTILSGAAGAAIPSFLEYTKDTISPEESLFVRARNAVVSGAAGGLGGGLGYGFARAIQPSAGAFFSKSGVSDDALNAAGRVGYKPTLGERTQNPLFQNIDNYFERTPGVAGQFKALREANQTAINRSASKAMLGEPMDEVGEATFKAADDAFKVKFPEATKDAVVKTDSDGMLRSLMKLDDLNKAAAPFDSRAVDDLVTKGFGLADKGEVDGAVYQNIRSKLGKMAESTTDTEVKGTLKSIQGALDDAARASLPADKAKALDEVRKQYAAWKTLTSGTVVQDGNVNAQKLASALVKGGNRTGFKTGALNSDLMDIARIGQAFKPPANPNSGSLLLTEGFAGSPARAAMYGALNYLPGKAYLNPTMQAYLRNNVLPPMVEQGLIRSGAPLGLGGLGYSQSSR